MRAARSSPAKIQIVPTSVSRGRSRRSSDSTRMSYSSRRSTPINPNRGATPQALGYDEIHKVTSCGLHLGGIYKIPKNVNDGIAILAKPELGLRRVGKKRLSGNAKCSATWGIQTKESRYALFGEITVAGQKVLVTTTHLASPAFTPADFDDQLEKMVTER